MYVAEVFAIISMRIKWNALLLSSSSDVLLDSFELRVTEEKCKDKLWSFRLESRALLNECKPSLGIQSL